MPGSKITGALSREIVKALDVTLSSDEDRRLADRPVADPRAFELFLQARQEIRRYNVSEQVQELITQAVAIEGRTPALKALEGWAKLHIVRAGLTADRHELDEAEDLARELLREAPDAEHGHHILGYVAYERGQNAEAVRHFQAAVERAAAALQSATASSTAHRARSLRRRRNLLRVRTPSSTGTTIESSPPIPQRGTELAGV